MTRGVVASKISAGLTTYADLAQLERSLIRAAPGDSFIYASGPQLGLPGKPGRDGHPTALIAAEWAAAGKAALFQRRSPARPDCFDYCVRRLADPVVDAGGPGSQLTGLAAEARRMLALLADLAARGQPCPSNAMLAEALDLPTREQARYRFNQLLAAGAIRLIGGSGAGFRNPGVAPRVIEIVGSGARTASSEQAA